MVRWCPRNISGETIRRVRGIQEETGIPAGSIVNACVEFGAESARAHLAESRYLDDEQHQLIFDLLQILDELLMLMNLFLSILGDARGHLAVTQIHQSRQCGKAELD